jgi:hypothetical protein
MGSWYSPCAEQKAHDAALEVPLVERVDGKKSRSRWWVVGCVLAAILAAALRFVQRPKVVAVAHPQRVSLMETIASSARVGGVQKSAIGAQCRRIR